MRKNWTNGVSSALRYAVFCGMLFLMACTAGKVKEPAVAGAFYPADEKELKKAVDGFLSTANKYPEQGRLIAVIAPHAGYMYSGQVAGYAYKQLEGKDIDTVILIGPSHSSSYDGVAVYTKGGMRTPLGVVKVNEKLAAAIINPEKNVFDFTPAFENEHSLEVQLPFLQRSLKDFTIVPVLVSRPTQKSFEYFTSNVAELLRRNNKVIVVISTDLSHYHDAETASKMDKKIIDAMKKMSIQDIENNLTSRVCEMCGGFPVLYALSLAKKLGANIGVVYKYADSGDATGDKNSVVGYVSMGFYKSHITQIEKEHLLSLAKETIVNFVSGKKFSDTETDNPRFLSYGSSFVTIKDKRNGRLRGCIGNIFPSMSLYESIIKNAVASCSMDTRFLPVKPEELPFLEYEVSILSTPEPINSINEIKVGMHGVVLEKGQNRSVFLPQVPVENRWNLNMYLEQLALKAGLPRDGWKGAQLYIFTSDIVK